MKACLWGMAGLTVVIIIRFPGQCVHFPAMMVMNYHLTALHPKRVTGLLFHAEM